MLFEQIYGENPYKSPTDMGVNMIGFCISDDEVCCQAARQEIIRRYYEATNKAADGASNQEEISKIKLLFSQANISLDTRRVVGAAKTRSKACGHSCAAIELAERCAIGAGGWWQIGVSLFFLSGLSPA